MKFTNNAQAALQKPDTQVHGIEMTPERKAKFSRVAGLVVDLLKQHSESPVEAYGMLQFVQHAFEDTMGFAARSSWMMPKPRRSTEHVPRRERPGDLDHEPGRLPAILKSR
jgi:peroxiredoxin